MATAQYQDHTVEEQPELRMIPLDRITEAPDNPRSTLTGIEELAASIRALGVLQPVTVEQTGDDTYQLVFGARRRAAAAMAGLTEIPALVRSFAPVDRKVSMLAENTGHVRLTPTEEASAYQELLALGVEHEALGAHVGRPQAEVDGRLAVLALPKKARRMLASEAITYAEALLLTTLAGHPEDVEEALRLANGRGWDVATAVHEVTERRAVTERAAATTAKLTEQGIRIVDDPGNVWNDRQAGPRRIGRGWGEVAVRLQQHRKEPCHAAAIGCDGGTVWVCTDPSRHRAAKETAEPEPDARAKAAATRAANRALREAAKARRVAAQGAVAVSAEEDRSDVAAFVARCTLLNAEHRDLLTVAPWLGHQVDGEGWDRWEAARTAVWAYAETDTRHMLSAALAVQLAAAERDASAQYERASGGRTVIAYLDLLTTLTAYEPMPGDAAVRERFERRAR